MTAELWQFGIMLAVFCVALILWLKIVYLPRRTLERWEDPDTTPRVSSSETAAEGLEAPDAQKGLDPEARRQAVISGLDHLVILVRDLDHAARDYEGLGFTVTPGGEHADGLTRNALVPFQDGSYLELVAFLDPEDTRDNVWGWRRFAAAGGLVDHCLASDDLAEDVRRMRDGGFAVAGPDDGGRRLPDGEEIHWRSASVEQEGRTLPFLIEDLTPRARRVPAGEAADHPNGAIGVSALEIIADDPEEAARSYAALAGSPASREGGETLVRLGRCAVSFSGPADDGARRRLDHIGDGPHRISLAVGAESGKELDPDLAHGARIRLL